MTNSMIMTALKGLCVGATMLVPGVSGGTMAMLLGCYDRLINAVSTFTRNTKEKLTFLAIFGMGGILGMMVFANPISYLLKLFPMPMMYFFIGTVAGGVPLMWQKADVRRLSAGTLLYPAAGVVLVGGLAMLPANLFTGDGQGSSFLILGIIGIVAAIALVLPGISVSYMFLLFGMYEEIIGAIAALDFVYLLPLGIGIICGTILISKILEKAMEKYPGPVYLTIMGFVLGSIAGVFPGIPQGNELLFSAATLAAGFLVMKKISSLEVL